VYALADRLHKGAHEILAMPAQELTGWLAYIEYQNRKLKQHG
jgi:hypothetical protein